MQDPIASLLLSHFPMAAVYMDQFDRENCTATTVATGVAYWFSENPNEPNQKMADRMKALYTDPRVSDNNEILSAISSAMQVGFFETLWWLPNSEITIPQVATMDYLKSNREYLSQWVGRDTYESVMQKLNYV